MSTFYIMLSRKELLTKLISINHLSFYERNTFEHSYPTYSELLSVAEEYFRTKYFLPSIISKWDDDSLCYEGYSLERKGSTFILHFQLAGPALDIRVNRVEKFQNLAEAFHVWLSKEFRFRIDGVPIIDQ